MRQSRKNFMPRGPSDRATVSAKIDLGHYLAQ